MENETDFIERLLNAKIFESNTPNLISIAYAIFATRPELKHGGRESNNLMFYGNFHEMGEADYIKALTGLINQGDELYRTIAKDTLH